MKSTSKRLMKINLQLFAGSPRLTEIETRMAAIKVELEADGADIAALETEVKNLKEERKGLLEKAEQRKKIIDDINAGTGTTPLPGFIPKPEERKDEPKGVDSPEYRSAFLKTLQGKPLTDAEKREFVLTPPGNAGSGAAAVPTSTANMIFDNMTKIAPMLNEIQLLRVAGNLRIAVQGTRNAAAVHVEGVAVVPAADTLVTVTLAGYEFIKVIRISATIQTMGIDAFEAWITKMLGEDIAVVIDNQIINGGSVTGNIAAAQAWVEGTNQITYVPGVGLAYSDITSLIGLLPSAFDRNAKFVMSKGTFYTQVLGMVDANGKPIAVQDVANSGRYSILGYPVLIDDNVLANEAYLGDFKQVIGNLSSDIKIDRSTESGFLNNSVDFRGTAIFDCDMAQPTAVVKLNV
jgi:HK97 family phage major capsid protein